MFLFVDERRLAMINPIDVAGTTGKREAVRLADQPSAKGSSCAAVPRLWELAMMRKLGLAGVATLAFFLALGSALADANPPPLDQPVTVTSPRSGETYTTMYRSDGTLTVTNASYCSPCSDTGRWWMSNGQFCVQYTILNDGQTICGRGYWGQH
jgi:hypothetical protein